MLLVCVEMQMNSNVLYLIYIVCDKKWQQNGKKYNKILDGNHFNVLQYQIIRYSFRFRSSMYLLVMYEILFIIIDHLQYILLTAQQNNECMEQKVKIDLSGYDWSSNRYKIYLNESSEWCNLCKLKRQFFMSFDSQHFKIDEQSAHRKTYWTIRVNVQFIINRSHEIHNRN